MPQLLGAVTLFVLLVFIVAVDRIHARVRRRKLAVSRSAPVEDFRTWEVREVDRMWSR